MPQLSRREGRHGRSFRRAYLQITGRSPQGAEGEAKDSACEPPARYRDAAGQAGREVRSLSP